jgi:hypothetical protein
MSTINRFSLSAQEALKISNKYRDASMETGVDSCIRFLERRVYATALEGGDSCVTEFGDEDLEDFLQMSDIVRLFAYRGFAVTSRGKTYIKLEWHGLT